MLRRPGIRLAGDRSGSAAVEFAFVLPLLLALFMGCFVISDMISCYRKVSIATRALADLVSRGVSPSGGTTTALLSTYINSTGLVLTPFSSANATIQISELRVCDGTHAFVVWSQAQTGATVITASQTAGTVVSLPANLLNSTSLPDSPLVPHSPDGSNVCNNATSGPNKVQVGTAGGYLYFAQVSYAYTPPISYGRAAVTRMADAIYMSPRLN